MLFPILFFLALLLNEALGASTHIPLFHRKRAWSPSHNVTQWVKAQKDILISKYGSAHPSKRATGSTSLVNVGPDISFYGSVSIGTPPVPFNVILDTGSADFWITASDCAIGCTELPFFDASSSSTFRNLSIPFRITYGSGSVAGTMGQDTIQIAGFNITEQPFALALGTTRGLLDDPVSGILGLAWSSISNAGALPLWEVLVEGGLWDDPVMAFHLTRYINDATASEFEPGGSFTMGSANTSLYTGDIDYVPTKSGRQQYWTIPLESLTMDGTAIRLPPGSLSDAIIDTGTSLIAGPTDVVTALYAQIPGSIMETEDSFTYFGIPCRTNVSIALNFGGQSWTMSPDDFRYDSLDARICLGTFFALDTPSSVPSWIIGDAFLKNVYSVFRHTPPSIGFARLSDTALAMNGVGTGPAPLPTNNSGGPSGTSSNDESGPTASNKAENLARMSIIVISLVPIFFAYLEL